MIDGDTLAYGLFLVLLLGWVLSWFWGQPRGSVGDTLQSVLVWVLIFLGMIIAYSFKDTISDQLFPKSEVILDQNTVVLNRNRDRHFYADLTINGQDIRFVVDTGATDVVLSMEDAERIGIDVDNLRFFGTAFTANGPVKTAQVKMGVVKFGPFTDFDVPASVNQGELRESLLGMRYLNKFRELRIQQNKMTLIR